MTFLKDAEGIDLDGQRMAFPENAEGDVVHRAFLSDQPSLLSMFSTISQGGGLERSSQRSAMPFSR